MPIGLQLRRVVAVLRKRFTATSRHLRAILRRAPWRRPLALGVTTLAAVIVLGIGYRQAARAPSWAAAVVNAAHALHLTAYRATAFDRVAPTAYPASTIPDPLLPVGLHEVRRPGRPGLVRETGILLYPASGSRPAAAVALTGGDRAARAAGAAPPTRTTTDTASSAKTPASGIRGLVPRLRAEVKVFSRAALRPPRPAVVAVGIGQHLVPIQGQFYHYSRVMTMEATAYNAGAASNGPYTGQPSTIGLPLSYGIVAVDPHVIPLGTRLYVQGYGLAVAADTGAAIVGDHIDLFFWDGPAGIAHFGIRYLQVYLLDDTRLPPVPVPAPIRKAFGGPAPPTPTVRAVPVVPTIRSTS